MIKFLASSFALLACFLRLMPSASRFMEMPHVRVRPERHKSAAQKCCVQPEVQVDDPLSPSSRIVQSRTRSPSVMEMRGTQCQLSRFFRAPLEKFKKATGQSRPRAWARNARHWAEEGRWGRAGNGQDLALEIAAPALGKATTTQDHILRVVQAAGAGGDVGPHRFHIGQEARLGVGFAGGHGAKTGWAGAR